MSKEFDDILATVLAVSKKEIKMHIHDDKELFLESIDIVSLVAAMDIYLNIKVKVNELRSCKYVRDIYKLIEEKHLICES